MKGWSFYIRQFEQDRTCYKCGERIRAKTPVVAVDYESWGKKIALPCCFDCTDEVINEEIINLKGLKESLILRIESQSLDEQENLLG